MGYRGWHGVQDHIHSLIAISYEPIDGTLACQFKSGEPYLYTNVPENIYQILLRSPFAGAYFRKHVKDRYPCLNQRPAEFKESEVPAEKLARMAEQRLQAMPEATMDLFGLVTPTRSQKKHRRA
jgi:KTSC domain-containing protein